MRHLKFSLLGLLTFTCGLALSGCSGSFARNNSATGTLTVSSTSVNFGQVAIGKTVSGSVTLTNRGSAAIEVSELNLTGQPFTLSGASSMPMTVSANASVTVTIQFDPTASGAATGQLTIASNASNATTTTVALQGTGVPVLTGLTCVNGSILGSASDSCTVTLNAAAGSSGQDISLSSNNGAVVVPASVTIPAGTNSAQFTAQAAAVSTTQSATLTANTGGVAQTFAVQLNAATAILGVSASSLAFGNVSVNSAATQSVVLSSTGTMPVTVSAAAMTGSGFSIAGAGLPLTLSPGQTTTVNIQFDPAAAGLQNGQLAVTSNSAAGSSTTIAVSGIGIPVLTAINCTNLSVTGSATDSCTATLNAAAATGGFTIALSSNNALVTVPTSVSVAAGASSATFTASISPVNSAQTATLTASGGSGTQALTLQLNPGSSTLNVSTSSVDFGDVVMNIPATQTVVLSSAGSSAITVSAASVSGTGFTATGATFPLTLNPNQSATLTLQFDPAATGSTTGTLSVASNASNNASWRIGLQGRGVPKLTKLSCASNTMTGAGTDQCTVTTNAAVPSGGLAVALSSNNPSFVVPASLTLPAGSNSGSFSATVSAVSVAQAVTVAASATGIAATAGVRLNAASISLGVSSSSLAFGNVNVNTAASQTLTLSSNGSSAVTVSAASVAGTGFTVSGASFPLTLNPGQTATLTVQFDPIAAGTATGQLTLTSNSASGTSTLVNLSGTGLPVLSGLTCGTGSFTGAGTDNCTVTLNTAAVTGGFSIALSSNNSAVTVPVGVTVGAGSTSASFTATVSSVSTAATVTLTASANSVAKTFALQLSSSGTPTLQVSATSIGFGSVNVKTAATQALTLSSTGTAAVTISSGAVSGSGFSISGVNFPLTLNPNQTATLTVQFDPTAGGASTGSLTFTSNSSTGSSTVVSLSGNGVPLLSALTCASNSITGAGTDSCTATLNGAAASSGFVISLSSNNSSVTVPASVTVASGATTGVFTATISSVSTAQTVTLTASAGGVAQTFALQLGTGVPTLSINATSIAFGSVFVSSPATQSVTLSSTGTAPVTVNAANVSGVGFSISGATFPLTLNPTQTATLSVEFNPTLALLGLVSGSLTITSNSSTGPTATIPLTGTGETVEVNLAWNAPSSSTDPVAGYNVYRAPSGSSSYQQLNASAITQTVYVDTTVTPGQTYSYIVESVDASGVQSVPSNTAVVVIP